MIFTFYSIEVIWPQPRARGVLPSPLTTTDTRLIWPVIRHTRACATFCFRVQYFYASTAAGIKRKKKKRPLASRFLLCLRRLAFTCCFTFCLCKMAKNGHFLHFWKSCHFSTNKRFLIYFFHAINLKWSRARRNNLGSDNEGFWRFQLYPQRTELP